MTTSSASRCPWCGAVLTLVHVHGHGQCAHCGVNVEPCCSGASAADEADDHRAGETFRQNLPERNIDPQFFARLFAHLGGASETVAEAALLHACQQKLGGDLEDARIVVEAGVATGALRRVAAGCYRLP